MSDNWVSAKPASKRGVNKANMDAPQPEFIDDSASTAEEKKEPLDREKDDAPEKVQP